jgi:3',5'-cyclic AMP phosphodiesterase CpdA
MKLIQFTDFHLRLTPAPQTQFHMQPFWAGDSRELFLRLGKLAGQADALLFTGDAAHGGGAEEIAVFFDLLAEAAAGKPVFIVAGNHDAVHAQWTDYFQRGIDKYPNIRFHDGNYPLGELDILLANNHYLHRDGTSARSWPEGFFPVPVLNPVEAQKLDDQLALQPHRPALLMIHCPTHALPATLSDYGPGVIPGMDLYRKTLHAVLDKHPRVRLVLSGHVHLNATRIYEHNRLHQSLASISEYPFQVRMIDLTSSGFQTRLLALARELDVEESAQR